MDNANLGTLDIAADRRVRFSRVTKRGEAMLDVREMDYFNGFWTPNKRAVLIPIGHARAFANMARDAAGSCE